MKTFLLCLFLLFNGGTHAKDIFVADDNFPLEFKWMIYFIQTGKKGLDISKEIREIDRLIANLSKSDIQFIVKGEIYREILSSAPNQVLNSEISANLYSNLAQNVQEKVSLLTDYEIWLLQALLADYYKITQNTLFKSFLTKFNADLPRVQKGIRSIEKQVNYVLPWPKSFKNYPLVKFRRLLRETSLEALNNIRLQLNKLNVFQKFQIPEAGNRMSFFKIIEEKNIASTIKERSVPGIIDPLLRRKNKLPVPKDDWIPKEDDFADFRTIKKPRKKDPNYVAPEVLPLPTNDWILDD